MNTLRLAIRRLMQLIPFVLLLSCSLDGPPGGLQPVRVSDRVRYDSDDPAIWVNSADPSASLVVGTDKHSDGALYVFDLEGQELAHKTIRGLQRPNNVDVAYGIILNGSPVDIAVVTERERQRLRLFALPTMDAVDGGEGIPVFVGESDRRVMGIGLYRRPSDGETFAIVSRKSGPSGSYLWQYRLHDDGTGRVVGTQVRSFGIFSGSGEIEAIAVDDELGFVYYSDELAGIRKYHADPNHPDAATQLAFFGRNDFARDREGISIYDLGDGPGYLLISDQQSDSMNIYAREGGPGGPHDHQLVKTVRLAASRSDGNEVTSRALSPLYPGGLFVVMSDDRTFHYYSWRQIAEASGTRLRYRE